MKTKTNKFLENIDKDIFIYSENRFKIKRYAYKKYNWIDSDGKPITERLFSFILYHGNKWFNDTNLNFEESELGENIIEKYKELILKKKAERKKLFTAERAMRKQFPRHSKWIFNNVTITVVEEMAYVRHSAGRGYPLIDSKTYTIYANEMPYRYCIDREIEKDFEFTTEWVLNKIATHYVAQYNVNKLSGEYQTKPVETILVEKFDYDFVPYQFFIGYVVEIEGVHYSIRDFKNRSYFTGFDTDKGEIEVSASKLKELSSKIIGEAAGIEAFVSLKNKFKYCE